MLSYDNARAHTRFMTATQTLSDTYVPLNGHSGSPTRRIGTVTLTQPQSLRQSYETACNYHVVEVPAGTEAELKSNGYYMFVKLPGVITESLYVNRVFSATSEKVDELKGEASTYTVQMYAYDAVQAIIAGTLLGGAHVRLDDGVRFDARQFDHGEHGGLKFHYGIMIAVD